jgi:hypothetical protein
MRFLRLGILAIGHRLSACLWPLDLSKSLDGIVLKVFECLSAEHRLDCDGLKYAVLKRF